MKLKLSDQLIVRFIDLMQLAILTQTDIVDNLRTIRVVVDGDSLVIPEDEDKAFNESVQNLAAKLTEQLSQIENTQAFDNQYVN
jgi:protein involved in polysaccharide export with SLBB domain